MMRLGAVASLVLLILGCAEGSETHAPPSSTLQADLSDESVATVGGRRLGAQRFEVFWAAHPKLERSEAIEAWIDRELLVADALDRGPGDAPGIVYARKSAMASALLEDLVDSQIDEDAVEPGDLGARIAEVRRRRERPAGHRTSSVLVYVRRKFDGERIGGERLARFRREALAFAREIDEAARTDSTPDALFEAGRAVSRRLPGYLAIGQAPDTLIGADGVAESELPEGWRLAPGLAKAARRMPAETLLPEPVGSKRGFSVVYLHQNIPSRTVTDEEARRIALDEVVIRRRSEEAARLVEAWLDGATFEFSPDVIAERRDETR